MNAKIRNVRSNFVALLSDFAICETDKHSLFIVSLLFPFLVIFVQKLLRWSKILHIVSKNIPMCSRELPNMPRNVSNVPKTAPNVPENVPKNSENIPSSKKIVPRIPKNIPKRSTHSGMSYVWQRLTAGDKRIRKHRIWESDIGGPDEVAICGRVRHTEERRDLPFCKAHSRLKIICVNGWYKVYKDADTIDWGTELKNKKRGKRHFLVWNNASRRLGPRSAVQVIKKQKESH